MEDVLSLSEIMKELSVLTGAQVCVYDLDSKILAGYPEQGTCFCDLISSTPEGAARCARADQEACAQVRRTHRFQLYRCHMGLYEALMPLYSYGTLAGFLMMGQMLEAKDESREEVLSRALALYPDRKEELEPALLALPHFSFERLESLVTLCRVCADYVTHHHQFSVPEDNVVRELRAYLEKNYPKDITLPKLCSRFGYSKTKLGQLFRLHTGLSIHEYLIRVRLEAACRLLTETEASIYTVAQSAGFRDQNYFSRAFRQRMGVTPGEYRRGGDTRE